MLNIKPQYITNSAGKKISVVLPMKDFKAILEELEELEDIKLYDKAKKRKQEFIDAHDAFKEIEKKREQKEK
jgi:hypothetical protein